jgi:hypothetical protein
MNYFCTYFDRHYLPRALALYRSLSAHCENFHLFALCMDDESHQALETLGLPGITTVRLQELEQSNAELLRTKAERSKVEYYYTCGPCFLLYVLQRHPEVGFITYLDADLFFFSTPQPIFDEMADHSVGIIEHRFTKRQSKLKRFGNYNVGWISFRRDECGLECLRWWAERCIEWCYDRVEENRFADQKYLDEFPARFESVRVIQHKGANVGPWNVTNYPITQHGEEIRVDGEPLIFFHFHGFKALSSWLFDTNLGSFHASPSRLLRQKVFGPYIRELKSLRPYAGPVRSLRTSSRNQSRGFGIVVRSARMGAQLGFGILRRAYIVDLQGTVR